MARAGIDSAETLRALGADAAYRQLLDHGERPHFIAYYVLVMTLQGRPWNDCRGAEKRPSANVSTRSRPRRAHRPRTRRLKKRSTRSGLCHAGPNDPGSPFTLEKKLSPPPPPGLKARAITPAVAWYT